MLGVCAIAVTTAVTCVAGYVAEGGGIVTTGWGVGRRNIASTAPGMVAAMTAINIVNG